MTKQYMGQIMAECDCQHHGCEMRGYCMAEKIVQLEQKVDEVERKRVKWMNKSDDAEARLAKAVEALRTTTQILSQCLFETILVKDQYLNRKEVVTSARATLAEIEPTTYGDNT